MKIQCQSDEPYPLYTRHLKNASIFDASSYYPYYILLDIEKFLHHGKESDKKTLSH